MTSQKTLDDRLDKILSLSGRWIAAAPLALIAVQFTIVVMVFVFGIGSIQLQESLQYLNALIFLGGAGYTALHDDHVRVDIFYSKMSPRAQALVRLIGTCLLLGPFLALYLYAAFPYVIDSWAIQEASIEVSGLSFVYILKTLILLFPLTLLLAGLSDLLKAVRDLKEGAA